MSKANHKNLHAFIWELLLDLEKCQSKAKDCSVMAKIQTLGKIVDLLCYHKEDGCLNHTETLQYVCAPYRWL